jgi:hypothetical protein
MLYNSQARNDLANSTLLESTSAKFIISMQKLA